MVMAASWNALFAAVAIAVVAVARAGTVRLSPESELGELSARLLPNQKIWFSDLDPDTGSSISEPRPNRINFLVSAIQFSEPIHTVLSLGLWGY